MWASGWYEARSVAAMVDDPAPVTAEQMDRWCDEFDNWAIVDTVCFNLFDRTPYAWDKVHEWSRAEGEFQKRASFALLWSLALHDKAATDAQFHDALELVERESTDERKYVTKSISMAFARSLTAARPLPTRLLKQLSDCTALTRPHRDRSADCSARIGPHYVTP